MPKKAAVVKEHPPKPHPKKHAPPHAAGHAGPADDPGHKPGPKKKGPGKHVRRAYEHLARVDALLDHADADAKLAKHAAHVRDLALEQLDFADDDGHKAAAELTRAAEHIAFASLVKHAESRWQWGGELQAAFIRQYDELREEAEEANAEEVDRELLALIEQLAKEAKRSRDDGNFARALECLRGVEALADAARHLQV